MEALTSFYPYAMASGYPSYSKRYNNNNNKLAKEPCIKRHYSVCTQPHFNICKETGVQLDKKHWYEHVVKPVETSQAGKVTILWNQQVQADRTIPSNKPDIIICDNEKGTCMLIDVAISGGRNVIKKEAEKILKYKDLTIGGRCVGLTTLPPSCAECLEIFEPQPPGTLMACPGL